MSRPGSASCGLPCKHIPREAPEPRPPPLRADARSSHDRRRRQRFRKFARDRLPINRRVERREASVPRLRGRRELSARGRAGRSDWPTPLTGAAAPGRLSALRSLACVQGRNWQSSEVFVTRENDDACSLSTRHPEVRGRRPSLEGCTAPVLQHPGRRPSRAASRPPQDDGERVIAV